MSESFNKRSIVLTVCLCALLVTATYCAAALMGLEIPDKLDAFAVGLVIGLIGLLGRTGTQAEDNGRPNLMTRASDKPIKTEVVNTEKNPVPVEDK
jgi:hypothetical protein